jgi:hypothetical protein
MEAKGGLVYDGPVRELKGAAGQDLFRRCDAQGRRIFPEQSCSEAVRFSDGAVFIFFGFAMQTLAELTATAAVEHWFVPVLAEGFGDIILVRVEIYADHCLAERL